MTVALLQRSMGVDLGDDMVALVMGEDVVGGNDAMQVMHGREQALTRPMLANGDAAWATGCRAALARLEGERVKERLAVMRKMVRVAFSLALTRTLGVEWAPRGVRVNAVCPGLIDTPQSRERLWPEEWMRETLLEGVPARKFGTEADVASAVLYLVAPETGYISGEVLTVDGGSSVGGVPYLRFVEKAGKVRRARGPAKDE